MAGSAPVRHHAVLAASIFFSQEGRQLNAGKNGRTLGRAGENRASRVRFSLPSPCRRYRVNGAIAQRKGEQWKSSAAVLAFFRQGFPSLVNGVQGLIIALVAALLLPSMGRLPVFVVGATLVHIVVDALLPVLARGAPLRLPDRDGPAILALCCGASCRLPHCYSYTCAHQARGSAPLELAPAACGRMLNRAVCNPFFICFFGKNLARLPPGSSPVRGW